ncbi:MAG: ATP-binding protein [Vicinamibacteria bacterium]
MNAQVEKLPASCPLGLCDGSGWIEESDDTARACECRDRRIAQARTRGVRTVLPAKYQGVSFDRPPVADMARDPQTRVVLEAVRTYIDELPANIGDGRGLWLEGDVGTGKTTLAMLVSKKAIEAGHSVAIYSLPRLLARIRRTYDGDASELSYLEFFRRLTSVDLLHIDDLGAEKRSDWVLEQLYAIVDERYATNRSIVVTTNMKIAELEEQIGQRTVSRLAEMCETLPMYGGDRRYAA